MDCMLWVVVMGRAMLVGCLLRSTFFHLCGEWCVDWVASFADEMPFGANNWRILDYSPSSSSMLLASSPTAEVFVRCPPPLRDLAVPDPFRCLDRSVRRSSRQGWPRGTWSRSRSTCSENSVVVLFMVFVYVLACLIINSRSLVSFSSKRKGIIHLSPTSPPPDLSVGCTGRV